MAHILVVDDEAVIREPLCEHIKLLGHQVDFACHGKEALERLGQREYDLILSDVMMPYLNGFELLKRLLPYIAERIPFVILSSVDGEEGVKTAIYAGAFDYLIKPCEPERLKDVLSRGLAQREAWVRALGPYRDRGAPVPPEALEIGEDSGMKPKEVPPSGVPAIAGKAGVLRIAAPDKQDEQPRKKRGFFQRIFGSKVA